MKQQKTKKKKEKNTRVWEKARCFRSAHNQRDDTKHTLWAVRASNLPTMRQKRVIAATRGDEVVRRTPFLCRCAFWFFVSASLVFVAAASKENEATVRATPSSSTSTVLRAEKWPLGHGGVRIFYYASNEEESEGEDADDNAVELSIVAGDDERKEEKEEEKIFLKSTRVIMTPSSSYPLGTTTILLASSDGVISQKMVRRVARLIWSKDVPASEKIAVFALRLTPELVVDYTSNNKEQLLRRLKEYTRLDHSPILPNSPFRFFSLRRALGSMPPDGLKNRLHHNIVFILDKDTSENKMFMEKARTLIELESSSAVVISSLFVNGDDKEEEEKEEEFAQWFGKFVKRKREEQTYVAAACDVSHKQLDHLLFGKKNTKLKLSPVSAVNTKNNVVRVSSEKRNNCRVEDVLRATYPYFDTITLKMDFMQRNEFEGKRSFLKGTYDQRVAAKQKFPLTVRFENAKYGEVYEERKATAKFHGTSTFRDCERRKSMKINLDGTKKIRLGLTAESDKFLLISLCYDDRYVKSWLMYSLLRRLGLFEDLEFRYVRLFVETNDVRESEGLYLLIENPVVKREDVTARLSAIVRRRLDPVRQTQPGRGAPDVKFPTRSEFDRAMKRNEYDDISRVAKTCDDKNCYRALKKRMNIDAYTRWIAFNSLVKMGDYVDEIYFYSSNENQQTPYWGIQAWDPDDMMQECHHGGKDAYIDRFRMLYCLEGSMDVVFLRSKDMYSRFVQTLEELLKNSVSDRVVVSSAKEQKKELKNVLNINNNSSNDDVSIGMLELRRMAKIPDNMSAFREMSNSLLYYVDQIRLRRRELLRVVGAFHSFNDTSEDNNLLWKPVRVERTAAGVECSNEKSPLKLRVSERAYDRDTRQEIVFEFDNVSSESTIIEIPIDLNVVYTFNETYWEKYLPVPVEKETRALCWKNATLPGDIINMNATDGGFLTTLPKKSCIAGEAVNVTADFTNEAVTFTMTTVNKTKTDTTNRDKVMISIYHGFWHPFFKAFADVKYARIIKC